MANLVAPVNPLQPSVERIIEFKGLNRKQVVAEGEMSDMLNLTADNYPLLTQRKPRGVMRIPSEIIRPLQLMVKFEKIAMIAKTDESVYFYYDGNLIPNVTGLSESTTMVAINTKICFFPEKTYLEISPAGVPGEYGNLESEISVENLTVTINTADTRLVLSDDAGFRYGDAITITGQLTLRTGSTYTTVDVTASAPVEQWIEESNTLVIPQNTFLEAVGADGVTLTGEIARKMPDLDHVIEWNNRLWGASNDTNTIYACKLGDPKNWQYYQGTGLDSYYAEQGTDGAFTGVATYSSHIIFLKQNSMCRIYGTAPSNFQMTNTDVFGCEIGSKRSVVTINDTVFWKSKIGIMAYNGGIPTCISDNLNTEYLDAVAGTEKRKYYVSMHKRAGGYELLVFDTEKGFWHKEDNSRLRSCATIGDQLYSIEYDDELMACSQNVICSEWLLIGSDDARAHVNVVNPTVPNEDINSMDWMAVFGPFDEYIEEHKIYSKLALRLVTDASQDNTLVNESDETILTEMGESLEIPRWVKVSISMDEGEWEQVELYEPPSTKGDFIPIVPRRCDRYSIKVEGKGKCDIKSLTRRVRQGSFGRI